MFSAFFRSLKQEFAGYNSKKLLADMMAGLTVCAVALPLALAFGVSSGASAASGLVTAIIAGVVIAILGGASYQISGPTGAMSAVLVGIVAEYGLQGVFFACFAAGVLLLLAGVIFGMLGQWLYAALVWAGGLGCGGAALNRKGKD